MSTPYPWAVILIKGSHAMRFGTSADGRRNLIAYQQVGKQSQEYTGEWSEDAYIHWADSEEAADRCMQTLVERYPQNSYAKVQTREVVVVPKAPPQRAIYTEKGLIPA